MCFSCISCILHYIHIMKHLITPEIAMAIRKGERDYAHLLCDMEIEQAPKMTAVTVDNLNENQKRGYDNLVRRLRNAA